MASSKYAASIALLLALLAVAAKGNIPPSLSPNFDEICKEVNCGRGTCKVDMRSKFGFKCECEANWNRTRFGEFDDDLEFLPCVIPNCTLDYTCMPAAPPTPPIPNNFSTIFDPCYGAYCGEGTCVKNLTYGLTCQCKSGYTNLLNVSAFPCYSDCALGSDCGRLGINVSRSSSSPNDESQAASFLPGKFLSITILLISAALAI